MKRFHSYVIVHDLPFDLQKRDNILKVIFMDVEPFDFHIVTVFDDGRFRSVGYFSRQRQFFSHNLSCFCVFPCYQGLGYGTFIVDFSYLLSRLSRAPGGPERPFSTQGLLVYRKYWCDKLLHFIYTKIKEFGWENLRLDIADLANGTGIQESEVLEALEGLCHCEWARSNRSLTVQIGEEALTEIGKYIEEKNQERLLAKLECLDPNVKRQDKWTGPDGRLITSGSDLGRGGDDAG
ncbi:unnamed protein product [Heligmosomoides polygyrus]|uniref:Histone acetyltransferase n=1 Tax=Heligmosomoides polygyrus TaxID=6339 RepID=A0A183FPM0_HELPZ|nr:unnamed protein product [Heligmosomoides polygyrus]